MLFLEMNASRYADLLDCNFFQELFMKLTRMASIATDMFIGRERFATVLLMRLTETVILWLSDDQTFWEEIEEGPKPLGPLGLQQVCIFKRMIVCQYLMQIFRGRLCSSAIINCSISMQLYLDMEFVLLFSSQGRYLSRNLHQVIKNIIARAIDAVAATGVDPYRYILFAVNIILFCMLRLICLFFQIKKDPFNLLYKRYRQINLREMCTMIKTVLPVRCRRMTGLPKLLKQLLKC